MPRIGRLHIPGGCYHLFGRGLERRYIFEHTVDKQDILARFGMHLQRTNCQCLAWALMSNHYHFLIRAGASPLKKLMSPVLSGFAGAYNRRYDRSGYVFQNRFSSILCDEQQYLLTLTRYIHLNPLRARMLNNLEDLKHYPWTGHSGLLGQYLQEWHISNTLLSHFGTTKNKAVKNYLEFMQAGINTTNTMKLSGGGLVRSYGGWEEISRLRMEHKVRIGDERILGESDFVQKVLESDEINIESKSELALKGWTVERLVRTVCDQLNVSEADLTRKSRANDVSKAKAMICYWGNDSLGLKIREVAERLNISQPAVSKWIVKGREHAKDSGILLKLDE